MHDEDLWSSWLNNARSMESPDGVTFFAAIEVDKRGIEPFAPLVRALEDIGGSYFTFSLDDGRTSVTTKNRLRHICMGRNIVQDYAMTIRASHVLFLDADLMPPPNAIPKLLEMAHPIVGGNVGTYCLSGPKVDRYPFPVQEHWNTAGFLLIGEPLLTRLRWRWDYAMSDDPCYARDAKDFFGYPTYVRKDIEGRHFPVHVTPIEQRHSDRTVFR